MSKNNTDYGKYEGRWPAIVREYDGKTRMCRVEIPGVTDGADPLPNAEIEYPIGDRSIYPEEPDRETEIFIPEGAHVWVAFIGGDSRYPIITGFRNARRENFDGKRRTWYQENVAILAHLDILIESKEEGLETQRSNITLKSGATIRATTGVLMKLSARRIELN